MGEIRQHAIGRLDAANIIEFNWPVTSLTQAFPKLSQANMSTPRAPSIDHMAISIAPVSEAGTMAKR